MSEWREIKLQDFTEILSSKRIFMSDYTPTGIPFYRSKEIIQKALGEYVETEYFISKSKFEEIAQRNGSPENGDILISAVGERYGIPYLVNNENDFYFKDGNLIWFRYFNKGLESAYLFYYLKSSVGQFQLKNVAIGSAQPALTIDGLKNLYISIPPLPEQKTIASILSFLDSKIDLLRRQNQTLENIAQTLFKRWFIDFEFPCLPQSYRSSGQVNLCDMAQVCTYKRVGGVPEPDGDSWFVYVLLCENGSFYKGMTNDLYLRFYEHYIGQGAKHTKTHKPVKIVHWEKFVTKDKARKREEELKTGYGRTWFQRQWEKSCQPTEQTSGGSPAPECKLRMAGKMVESELGEIPEGWKVAELNKCIDFLEGPGIRNWQYAIDGFPFINIRLINNGNIDVKKASSVNQKEACGKYTHFHLKEHDFVMSTSGTLGKHAIVRKNHLPLMLNTSVIRFRPTENMVYSFMCLYLKSRMFYNELIAHASGSVQLNFGPMHLNMIDLILPANHVLKTFDGVVMPLIKKMLTNMDETDNLTKIRDTLLPKLMSGQIRVPVSE